MPSTPADNVGFVTDLGAQFFPDKPAVLDGEVVLPLAGTGKVDRTLLTRLAEELVAGS